MSVVKESTISTLKSTVPVNNNQADLQNFCQCNNCTKRFKVQFSQQFGKEKFKQFQAKMVQELEMEDFPSNLICLECLDKIGKQYELEANDIDKLTKDLAKKVEEYKNKNDKIPKDNQAELEQELAKLLEEEKELDQELGGLDKKNQEYSGEIFDLIKKRPEVNKYEEDFWTDMSSLEKQQIE